MKKVMARSAPNGPHRTGSESMTYAPGLSMVPQSCRARMCRLIFSICLYRDAGTGLSVVPTPTGPTFTFQPDSTSPAPRFSWPAIMSTFSSEIYR